MVKYLVKQILEGGVVTGHEVKYITDNMSLPRGGGFIFVHGLETSYPKVDTDEDGKLIIIEDTVKYDSEEYKVKRKKAYPKVGDQLDLIYKMTKHLKANGLDLSADGDSFIELIEAVKTKHPKPSKGL